MAEALSTEDLATLTKAVEQGLFAPEELASLQQAMESLQAEPPKKTATEMFSGAAARLLSGLRTFGRAAITPGESFFSPISEAPERISRFGRDIASSATFGLVPPTEPRTEEERARQVAAGGIGLAAPFTGIAKGLRGLGLASGVSQRGAGAITGLLGAQGGIQGRLESSLAGAGGMAVPQLIGRGAKALLPKAAVLQEEAAGAARAVPGRVKEAQDIETGKPTGQTPGSKAGAMEEQLARAGWLVNVALPKTAAAAEAIVADEGVTILLGINKGTAMAERIHNLITKYSLNVKDVREILRDLNDITRHATRRETIAKISEMRSALLREDLEAAKSVPGSQAAIKLLEDTLTVETRKAAGTELAALIEPATQPKLYPGTGSIKQPVRTLDPNLPNEIARAFNLGRPISGRKLAPEEIAIEGVAENPTLRNFAAKFPGEAKEVIKFVEELSKRPTIATPDRLIRGPWDLTRLAAGATALFGGSALGHPEVKYFGAVLSGAELTFIVKGALLRASVTPAGRAMVRKMLRSGPIDNRKLGLLMDSITREETEQLNE